MKADVAVERLDADKEIRLSIDQTDPREPFAVRHDRESGGATGYLSAPEAYRLALELLRAAARVGLTVRD